MRKLLYATASAIAFTLVPAVHAQWQLQTSNTTAGLRGIHNVGNGVAWASGTDGTVLRTEDGGNVWQTCTIPTGAEKLDFRGIQAFDAKTAIVMSSGKGDQSRLYKTTDACHTWKLLFTNPDPDGFWDAVIAEEHDMAVLGDPVGGSFVLEKSHDSGATWKRQAVPPAQPDEGAFAASNSSFFADWADGVELFGTGGTNGARLFISCDPCTKRPFDRDSWYIQDEPEFGHSQSSGVFSVVQGWVGQNARYVAVGGDYSKPEKTGVAAFSSDLDHWRPAKTPPHGYRSSVDYDEKTKTWITVGPNGTDISTDDGKNWRPVHPNPALHESPDADRNWNALSLPYVVGPHGRIGKLDPAALKN